MTSPYIVTTPLTIPNEVFAQHGAASLVVQGSVETGPEESLQWELNVTSTFEDYTPLGAIVVPTDVAFLPGGALEITRNWVLEECKRLDLELLHFAQVMGRVDADEELWRAYANFHVVRTKTA